MVSSNNVGVLIVPQELKNLSNSLEFLNNTYKVAKNIYPDIHSLIVVSDPIYSLLVRGDISLHEVQTLR